MLKRIFSFYFVFFILYLATAFSQCPINIGFDTGDFTNWEGSVGNYPGYGVTNLNTKGIQPGIHTIISRKSQQTDPFGQFSLVSPNGSNYIAQLGNGSVPRVDANGNVVSSGYGRAQQLAFTFKVPDNNNNFSLIYYYAVVLEDPVGVAGHNDDTKPKFSAAVFDVGANKYADCGNFNFVAISSLPGFVKAPVQTKTNDVYYKDWSAVTIDLRGYAGKTLRLEFTTNNCSPSGHFAYAYIDVNQNCASPVSGNMKCPNSNGVTLSAPSGFAEYYWYNEKDFSTVIGRNSTLTPTPTPPVGTGYSVRIVPYPGIGCPDTIYTTILKTENPIFNVNSPLKVCRGEGADITATNITANTDPTFINNGLVYYDSAMNIVPDPTNITIPDTYYIQATANSGCNYIKPIVVSFSDSPLLTINNPPEVCQPTTVDITDAAITKGSTLYGQPLSYWTDASATIALANPNKIAKSNTYYIKAANPATGCYDIKPVTVLIDNQPVLQTHTVNSCNSADITAAAVTAGSTDVVPPFRYFLDAATTTPLTEDPKAVTQSNTYYIQAFNKYGCSITAPVLVNISPYPQIVVTNPAPVVFPKTVDITNTFIHSNTLTYTYSLDKRGINVISEAQAQAIQREGTYYIQAINKITGCSQIFPVKVSVLPPGAVDFSVNTFTPNGDGTNDVFMIKTTASIDVYHFRIFNSYGQLLFETTQANKGWDGSGPSGKRMPLGTYYWIFEGFDKYNNLPVKKAGSIALVL